MIIAHRGESFDAPENTLAAFNLAWNRGAEAIEFDIHLTLDNEIVVIHDKNTKRTGDQNLSVKHRKLSELRQVDVGGFKGKKWKGEKIPTLKEVLDTIPDHGKLIIEIKSDRQIIPVLVKEINSSVLRTEQIEIIAFSIKTLAELKKFLPDYRILWLIEFTYYQPKLLFANRVNSIINTVKLNNLDGVDIKAGKMVSLEFVNNIVKSGLDIYLWTVNDPLQAQKFFNWGVHAVTTDWAQWLRKELFESAYPNLTKNV